jgi:hypothetical protein
MTTLGRWLEATEAEGGSPLDGLTAAARSIRRVRDGWEESVALRRFGSMIGCGSRPASGSRPTGESSGAGPVDEQVLTGEPVGAKAGRSNPGRTLT